MSAIVGLLDLNGRPVDRPNAQRMVDSLAHRGSDGSGCWVKGPVCLGHRMLWTTPESKLETMPLVTDGGDLVLTADARLDNRNELIRELDFRRPDRTITDAELILAAYQRWGELCPAKLLGDFAFVIWDGRRGGLYCARDHFGVRPLYYYRSGRLFAFASEIKALLALPEVPKRLDEVQVASFLTPNFDDREITFYEGIRRLPAAHSLTVGPSGSAIRRYWSLDPLKEVRLGSDQEYAEAFREIFSEAVRCRLRSAYPPGSTLSGGLDSSFISCVARRAIGAEETLHTFSAIFDDIPECDERRYIEPVVAQGGISPHYVHADRLNALADLDRDLWLHDEPIGLPNLFMHGALYASANEQGVRVLLDGFDGDTTVSHGVYYLTELARAGNVLSFASEARALSKSTGKSYRRMILDHAIRPLTPGPVRAQWRRVSQRTPWDATIDSGFTARVDLRRRLEQLGWSKKAPNGTRAQREEHWRRLSWGLFQNAFEGADKAAAVLHVRPAYPFMDKRLAEFCLALPPEQKLHSGWTRMVMRRAMEGIVPGEVQWRRGKSNLSPMFKRAFAANNAHLIEEVVTGDWNEIDPYIDHSKLDSAYRRYVHERSDVDVMSLWRAVMLASWLRKTRLGRPRRPVPIGSATQTQKEASDQASTAPIRGEKAEEA